MYTLELERPLLNYTDKKLLMGKVNRRRMLTDLGISYNDDDRWNVLEF